MSDTASTVDDGLALFEKVAKRHLQRLSGIPRLDGFRTALADELAARQVPRLAASAAREVDKGLDAAAAGPVAAALYAATAVAAFAQEAAGDWSTASKTWEACASLKRVSILKFHAIAHHAMSLAKEERHDDARCQLRTANSEIDSEIAEQRRRANNSEAGVAQFFHSLFAGALKASDEDLADKLGGVSEWQAVVEDLLLNPADTPERVAKWRLYTALAEGPDVLAAYKTQHSLKDSRLVPRTAGLLAILKGWSSSIPLVAKSVALDLDTPPDVGGGCLLQWGEMGLCIDPGLGFVQNLHSVGGHIRDIDGVLTSHNHLDHTADLERVHNLSVEFKHPVDYFFDCGTLSKKPDTVDWGEERPPVTGLGGEAWKDDGWGMVGEKGRDFPFRLRAFNAIHPKADSPIGFRLEAVSDGGDKCTYGFTCDTEADPDDGAMMYSVLDDVDILVLNFSKTDWVDLRGDGGISNHLGYTGCTKVLQRCRAKLYLLSEWSAERGDMRFEVMHMLQAQFPGKLIMAADVGLMIATEGATDANKRVVRVLCESCQSWTEPESITALRPETGFGRIRYRCRYCLCGSGVVTSAITAAPPATD